MANQTGRPVAPARKLVAAVMGTIAVFVVALGLGMSSWGVVIFGIALLALSIALGMVNVVRRGARAWVSGSAEVKAISPRPTSSAVYGRAEIHAVVVAPGLPTSEVTIREPRVPVVKWPVIGDTLPITVDVDDMRRVRINWDEATPRERGEDPPPPPQPPYEEPDDELDAELLDDVDTPPWASADRGWRGDDDPPPPPPPGTPYEDAVVVRDTPAGRVVEGELVNHDDTPPPLPRRASGAAAPPPPPPATTSASATRPAGTPPSPRPRGAGATATATADPQAPATAPEEQAPQAAAATPTQRTPQDDTIPVDLPLDEPAEPPAPADAPPRRRPEPTPASTPVTPTPTTTFPTAPPPMTPPPTAPAPTTPHDDIDLPLDGDDLTPPPESTPQAADAVAEDLIAPPSPTTRFISNAAHDAEAPHSPPPAQTPPPAGPASPPAAPAEPAPEPATHGGVIAGAAAAVGAVAAAAAAAVKRAGRSDKHGHPETPPAPPQSGHPVAGPWADLPGSTPPDDHADTLITAYPSARPGPAGAIHGVGITVLVTDLPRSVAFYRDTLGFFEIDNGEGSAVLASGDTRLVLRTVHDLSAEAGRLIYLNLEVGDIEAVYTELQTKGVVFVHPPQPVNRGDRLELWSATFHDPDDHNIAITQWRAIR